LNPTGDYIKRYIPELRPFLSKFIHNDTEVIIGQSYSLPMFDLNQQMQINCQRMKNIRESIVSKPSNEDEIWNFFWIADEMSIN
jgi:hypothetical protein